MNNFMVQSPVSGVCCTWAALCILKKGGGTVVSTTLEDKIDQLFAERAGVPVEQVTKSFIRRRQWLTRRKLKKDDTNEYGGRTTHGLKKLTRHDAAVALKAFRRTIKEGKG